MPTSDYYGGVLAIDNTRRIGPNDCDYNMWSTINKDDILTQLEKQANKLEKPKEKELSKLRIVSIYIVDADENIDREKAILFKEKEMLTDLTDQELFFEIDLKSILAKHNKYRKTVDFKDEKLKAITYKDLKMNVVTIASF